MLTTAVLPVMIALNAHLPANYEIQTVPHPVNIFKQAMEHRANYIADPLPPVHGPDPHDEQHDQSLPANAHAGDGYPSSDPYNGTTGNNIYQPNKPY